jgi:hypothetical protein
MSVSFQAQNRAVETSSVVISGREYKTYQIVTIPPEIDLNWSNANARLVFGACGLENDDLCGVRDIYEMRRAIIFGRHSMTSKRAPQFARQVEIGPRFYSCGLSEDQVVERIERLADYVETAAKLGATHCTWG